ncbi:hypothetical protein ACOME3_000631 [Neoechinorhynchus agilis]
MNDYSISLESHDVRISFQLGSEKQVQYGIENRFAIASMTNRMEKVDLLNANCRYSTIQFDDGHKSIIPTKELALYSNNEQESEDGEISHLSANNNAPQDYENEETEDETHAGTDELSLESPTAIQQPRRSSRIRKPPRYPEEKYKWGECDKSCHP